MLEYLKKFKKLPNELRQGVSSGEAASFISALEKKYQVDLDLLVIKIMVKEISWPELVNFLISEFGLSRDEAQALRTELENTVFKDVKGYLGISQNNSRTGAEAPKPAANFNLIKPQPKPLSAPEPADSLAKPYGGREGEAGQNETKGAGDKLNKALAEKKDKIITLEEQVESVFPPALAKAGLQDENSIDGVRLKNIIITYLKGIRGIVNTRETLMKHRQAGGLEMDDAQADEVIKVLKSRKRDSNQAAVLSQPVQKPARPFDKLNQVRDIEYVFDSQKPFIGGQNLKPATHIQEFTKDELSHELAPPPVKPDNIVNEVKREDPPSGPGKKDKAFVISPASLKRAEDALKQNQTTKKDIAGFKAEQQASVAFKRINGVFVSDKARMDDIVKPPSRLEGPVEELGNLDLVKFRRLGESAEMAAKKIEDKIRLLEKEGFTKRQQGINAWRKSPVYKIYIGLGQESFAAGRPVEELIKSKSGQEDVLTIDEFNAIVELNERLRL